MKVSLIHCGNLDPLNPSNDAQKNVFYMPMGTLALAGLLDKKGFEVNIIHTDLQNSIDFEIYLDIENTQAVGFDLHWINQSKIVIDTALAIKRLKPEMYIFIGGFSASLFHKEIMEKYSQIDFIIRGDAEIPLIHLCKTLRKRSELSEVDRGGMEMHTIPNLTWRNKEQIIVNDLTYTISESDLDDLDFSRMELMKNCENYISASQFYSHFSPICDQSMFLLEIGRGCDYNCLFCGGNSVAQKILNNRKKTVFRSVSSVMKSIDQAYTYGYRTFYVSLENRDSEKWYIELFKQINSTFTDINISYGAWSLPSKKFIDELSSCVNQAVIEISPESGNEKIRNNNIDSRTFFTNEELHECLSYIKEKGNIKVQIFFGYYLFGDSQETILETLQFIAYLLCKYEGFAEIEYANFSTDPASLFYLYPEKYELDMNVRSFEDFLNSITDHFSGSKNATADLTLFKPNYIDQKTDSFLHELIKTFNLSCTVYKLTFAFLNQKFDKFISAINYILDVTIQKAKGLSVEIISEVILQFCIKSNIDDDILLQLLEYEKDMYFSKTKISKPTTQLYFDYSELDEVINNNDFVKNNLKRVELPSQQEEGDFNF